MRAILLVTALTASLAVGASAQAPDGKALYDENCRKCHGVQGLPPQALLKKFAKLAAFDAAFMAKRSDDSVVKILVNGKGEGMKSYREKLNPAEMKAVALYLRQLSGKKTP